MAYDDKQLLYKERIAWRALMTAENNKAFPFEVSEKRREWSELYQECKKRNIVSPII